MTALFQRLPSGRRFLMVLVVIAIGAGALPLAGQQTKSADAPDLIKPGDWLHIEVVGTLPDAPIDGLYQVEASGKVALGPQNGRVKVVGKTLEEAEEVLLEHLARSLAAPKLQITRYELPPRRGRSAVRVLERRVDEPEKEGQPRQTEKVKARTKELQQKRLAVLEEIHDSAKRLFASARTSFEEVHSAAGALLAARILYAESQTDRIKACDEAVHEALEWQKFAQQMVQAGQATGIVELKAQAYLLEAQIAREKAETED